MKVNRRRFLQILSSSAAAAYTLDPEKLLWIPGEKTIFIPPPRRLIWASEIHEVEMENVMELVKNFINNEDYLYETLVTNNLVQLYQEYTK